MEISQKNENGVYEIAALEKVAERGRSYAEVRLARCDDGLIRYSVDLSYSYGGFSGPITDRTEGFQTEQLAIDAGVKELLRNWPARWASDPRSVHDELSDLKRQLENRIAQPFLF